MSFLVIFGGHYWFTVLQLLLLTKWFLIQTSIIHVNISSQVVDKRTQGFGQWMNWSIIHYSICSLIHKKSHPRSYHSYIKYHMTLNIIFSVVKCKKNWLLKFCTWEGMLCETKQKSCNDRAFIRDKIGTITILGASTMISLYVS